MHLVNEKAPDGEKVKSIGDGTVSDIELLKARLQFAWNWFEFHARQRMTMFNYFLLTTGILVNAYAGAFKEKMFAMCVFVGALGFLQSLGFLMIDVRSRELISYSEDALEKLERDTLFPDSFHSAEIRKGAILGLLRRDRDESLRQGQRFHAKSLKKMKYWMRGMYGVVLFAFALVLLDSIFRIFCGTPLFSIKTK
jgi:hypothetical protein